MKIELKNIKYAEFASEETPCYEASLYVDGKRIGVVSNDGHGGPDRFDGDSDAYKAAEAWVSANHPVEAITLSNGQTMDYQQSLESVCHERLTDHLILKDLKRSLKRAAVFFTPDNPDTLCEIKVKRGAANKTPVEALVQATRREHPSATILNELSEADALAQYKRLAAA